MRLSKLELDHLRRWKGEAERSELRTDLGFSLGILFGCHRIKKRKGSHPSPVQSLIILEKGRPYANADDFLAIISADYD